MGDAPAYGEGRLISGRYRLLCALGAGGTGRVWLAYDEELACVVSLEETALPDVPIAFIRHIHRHQLDERGKVWQRRECRIVHVAAADRQRAKRRHRGEGSEAA